jgi:hypothetical protein
MTFKTVMTFSGYGVPVSVHTSAHAKRLGLKP